MRPSASNTPAERSPASRTEVEKAVRTSVWACSSTTAMRRDHMICMWICARAEFALLITVMREANARGDQGQDGARGEGLDRAAGVKNAGALQEGRLPVVVAIAPRLDPDARHEAATPTIPS